MDKKTSRQLVKRWRKGDQDAATALFERYVERLTQLVGAKLSSKMNARVDPDDIAQSAFKSMFRRVREGDFEFGDDRAFWQLLVTIAVNKVRNKVRFAKAGKRDISRDSATGGDDSYDAYVASCLERAPSSDEVVEFEELMEGLFNHLPRREARTLQMRMDGQTQQEIAAELDVDVRTVRRDLEHLKVRLKEMFEVADQ
jgi:RNA polymerase sigma-70 factor, ECF subfamily